MFGYMGGRGRNLLPPDRKDLYDSRVHTVEQYLRSSDFMSESMGGRTAVYAASGDANSGDVNYCFNGSDTSTWSPESGSTYPFIIERSFSMPIRMNRLSIHFNLGPTCPIFSTHGVYDNAEGYYTDINGWVEYINWWESEGYQFIWLSEFYDFMRSGKLPIGVTKPACILFCGARHTASAGIEMLHSKEWKYNITLPIQNIESDSSAYISLEQLDTYYTTGLFEAHVYMREQDFYDIQVSPDGERSGNMGVFPEYNPNTGLYANRIEWEQKFYKTMKRTVDLCKNRYKTSHVFGEVTGSGYNPVSVSVAHAAGIEMFWTNASSKLLSPFRDLYIFDGGASLYVVNGTVQSIKDNMVSITKTGESNIYQYEVWVSEDVNPDRTTQWETSGDWRKVVSQREAQNYTLDPLFMTNKGEKDSANVHHMRIKLIDEITNHNLPKIYHIKGWYESHNPLIIHDVLLKIIQGILGMTLGLGVTPSIYGPKFSETLYSTKSGWMLRKYSKYIGLLATGDTLEVHGHSDIDFWVNSVRKALLKNDFKLYNPGSGLIVTTPDGSKSYKISVDNGGNITTIQI